MNQKFEDFVAQRTTRFAPELVRTQFVTFVNRKNKLFLVPISEVWGFIAAWHSNRSSAEDGLARPVPDYYAYLERPFRSATKNVVRESGGAFALQTISSLAESQTAGLFDAIDTLVRAHCEVENATGSIALDRSSVDSFLEAATAASEIRPEAFNSRARRATSPYRPVVAEIEAFTFANSNGKRFWIPVVEIESFIDSWHSLRALAEEPLAATDRPDLYRYSEPPFRKAAGIVVSESGRDIEMRTITPLLGSQTPGLFEIVDLYIRWNIGDYVVRGSISLSHESVAAFIRARSSGSQHVVMDIESGPASTQQDGQDAALEADGDRLSTWDSALRAALATDGTSFGQVWRAGLDHGTNFEAIRDSVAPSQPIPYFKKLLGIADYILSANPRTIVGNERAASTQIQRFANRHSGIIPETHMARLLSLSESALTLALENEASRQGTRNAGLSDAIPGIYVYALPHYLSHPVSPSADDTDSDRTLMKVGVSERDTIRRFRQQQRSTELPEDPQLLRIYVGSSSNYVDLEGRMHTLLRAADHRQARGQATGTEWFLTSLKFLDAIATSMGLSIHETDDPREI